MPQPQPGDLDYGRSQPGIAGLGDALVPMDRSALPRRRGQPGIGGNLLSVAERAEQAFRPERDGRLGSDASQRQQLGRWRWHTGARLRLGQHGIALGFDSLDLFDQQLEPVELAADLGLQALRKGATIARDQRLKPLPAVAVQGLVVANPLGEQKPLDAIDVPDPFGCQGLALATDPAPILLLGRRSLDHRTNPGLAPLGAQQGPHQSLTVDLVGLRPPTPTGRRDRGGIDDMALDPFALQDPVDPGPGGSRTRWIQDPSSPASWMTMMGKTCPVRTRAFSLSWDKRARRAPMSPLRTECFDIFSPPPGAREVMTQVERLSSRDTKIALRSVRTAACSSGRGQRACMVAPGGCFRVQHPHSAREPGATNRTHGISSHAGSQDIAIQHKLLSRALSVELRSS